MDWAYIGDLYRLSQGIDGTAGDAQDIEHFPVIDPVEKTCILCGLAKDYKKHTEEFKGDPKRACSHGILWNGMSFSHWAMQHKVDHP